MQINFTGRALDAAYEKNLRSIISSNLNEYTNEIEKVTVQWKQENEESFACILNMAFFNHQAAQTTYWDSNLTDAVRMAAEVASKLAVRCVHKSKKAKV